MERVRERLSVIGYTNHMKNPEVLPQKSKIQSDRFHQTFRETGTLEALRNTTLKCVCVRNLSVASVFFNNCHPY